MQTRLADGHSMRLRTIVAAAAVFLGLVVLLPTTLAAGGTGAPGSAGLGDSYFPLYGNGGYDVGHYDLHIRYSPGSDRLIGDATITAQATMDLSRFNLDFVGLETTRCRSTEPQPAGRASSSTSWSSPLPRRWRKAAPSWCESPTPGFRGSSTTGSSGEASCEPTTGP